MNKKIKYALLIFVTILMIIAISSIRYQLDVRRKLYVVKINECQQINGLLDRKLNDLRQQSNDLLAYKEYFDRFNHIKLYQVEWSNVIKHLSNTIPPAIWLEKFSANCNQEQNKLVKISNKNSDLMPGGVYNIIIDGKSTHPKHIKTFLSNLDSSAYFQDKSLRISNKSNLTWEFQVMSFIKK